jgi:hypothetical protein
MSKDTNFLGLLFNGERILLSLETVGSFMPLLKTNRSKNATYSIKKPPAKRRLVYKRID